MRFAKTLGALALATVVLGALVGTASANSLSISAQNIRTTWTRVDLLSSNGLRISCALTLEGSLHSATISKVNGALIGYITRGSVANCTGGTARLNTETLPWHESYNNFTGTLPNIAGITTISTGSAFETNVLGFGQCRWSGGSTNGSYGISGGRVTEVSINGTGYRPSSSLCGTSGTLSSSAGIETVLGTTTSVTVTLI